MEIAYAPLKNLVMVVYRLDQEPGEIRSVQIGWSNGIMTALYESHRTAGLLLKSPIWPRIMTSLSMSISETEIPMLISDDVHSHYHSPY